MKTDQILYSIKHNCSDNPVYVCAGDIIEAINVAQTYNEDITKWSIDEIKCIYDVVVTA